MGKTGPLTPSERRLRAQIAANTRWSRTSDRTEATRPALEGMMRKFYDEVDPDRELPTAERERRAEQAKRAHFQRLALKSAQARRAKVKKPTPRQDQPTPTSADGPWQPNHPLDRAVVHAARSMGWSPTNVGEAKLAIHLAHCGLTPNRIVEQHPVGRYRLDFADVDRRVAYEADGWVHTAANVAAKDRERDAWLAGQGWLVHRIDIDGDIDAQLAEIGLSRR